MLLMRRHGRRMVSVEELAEPFRGKIIKVRKATFSETQDFADLILLSVPSLFPTIYGDDVKATMQCLFSQRRNLFSFEHVYLAELGGKRVGMLLGYDWRARSRESWRTGFLMLKQMKGDFFARLPLLIKVGSVIGMVSNGEYHVSNIATYPEYRGMGIGARLMCEAEGEAKKSGAARSVLDVEVENADAIRLYSRLGYSVVRESSVHLRGGKEFRFYRMTKQLK